MSAVKVCKRCGMGVCAGEMKCGSTEWMRRNTLRWPGQIERMGSHEFVKKVYLSVNEGPNRSGRPL